MWATEGDEITSIANIVDGKSYYIKGVRNVSGTPTTYYLTFTDATGSQSGTESANTEGAQLITFHLVSSNANNKVFTLETSSGNFIAPGTANGKIAVSASGVNVTATNQSSKIRLSITSGSNTWSIQKNTSAANFGGYKNTQTDITLIEGPSASAVAKPTISGLESFLTSTEVSISCGTDEAAIQYSTNGGTTWNNYTNAFTLTETTTVQAKATKSGLTDSEVASKTFTKTTAKTVAEALTAINALEDNGTISGYYVKGIVSTAGSLSSGKITYSISDDGTTASELKVYSGKGLNDAFFTSADDIQVGDKVTVYGTVKKYVSGTTTTPEFDTGNYLYSIIKKPTFSPVAGAVAAGTEVTISSTLDGATIYYTTNGTAPTTSSSVYSSPIIVNAAMTIKAIAVKDGYPESSVAEAAYTIAAPCETPTFSVVAGAYSEAKSVTIASETEGATIYYTTDGTTPTTSSTAYTSAISVSSDMTIKAIAVKNGHANSNVAEATYTFYAAIPFEWDSKTTPVGVTNSGVSTYNSSPYLKFDDTGDYIIIKINAVPGTLTYDIKGNSFSGGTFKVQTSADGEAYSDLKVYTSLGDKTTESFILANTVRYIKWIYTEKSSGNVALGKINLTSTIALTPAKTYTTLTSAKDLDFTSVSDDLKAFIATEIADSKVQMVQVNKVPAGTGLVLKATTPGSAVNVPVFDGTGADDVSANKMAGSATETTAIAANGGYILKDGVFQPATAGTLAAGKAYLAIAAGARALEMSFDDGEVTAIETVKAEKTNNEYYNLAGQRVAQPTKGLYIVNGKKVIMK